MSYRQNIVDASIYQIQHELQILQHRQEQEVQNTSDSSKYNIII